MSSAVSTKPIYEMTRAELEAAAEAVAVSEEEMLRRHPHVIEMRANVAAAVKDLQAKGILDENGRLIPPKELPEDMRPESDTEC